MELLQTIKERNYLLKNYIENSRLYYDKISVDLNNAKYKIENKELSFNVFISDTFQAYEKMAHGGIISSLLDSVGGVLCIVESGNNKKIFTKSITINYIKPLTTNKEYECFAKFISIENDKIFVSSTIKDLENIEFANAVLELKIINN